MRCDVVVCGAGPAGAAYAYAATRRGAAVLLAGPPPRHEPNTLELIHGRAREPLERLGLFATIIDGATPCAGVVGSWGSAGLVDRPALLEPRGGGWIVGRADLDARLIAAALEAGATRIEATVQTAEPTGAGWLARLSGLGTQAGGRWRDIELSCARLVVATGRASRLVSRCGVARIPHRLVAIVAWVESLWQDLGNRLRVDAATDGWWWALGRGTGTSAGFCTDLDLLRPGSNRAAMTWAYALGQEGWPAARVAQPRLRCAFTGILSGAVPTGMDIIGDAALAVDPLSGHGLTLAFESAWQASIDPAGYHKWLAKVTADHLSQERAVYGSAGLAGPFWERRAACGGGHGQP